MFGLLKISGDSLTPSYQEGDFVLVSKIPYLLGTVEPGDVIAFRHGEHGIMIKQVQSVLPDQGLIEVIGTHVYSVDSRRFGPIRKGDVLGKVIWHIRKPSP
jgi:signal peptidase I